MTIWSKKVLKFLKKIHELLVVHIKHIQESFHCIRNVKTLWLVTVPKNVANFGLIYK